MHRTSEDRQDRNELPATSRVTPSSAADGADTAPPLPLPAEHDANVEEEIDVLLCARRAPPLKRASQLEKSEERTVARCAEKRQPPSEADAPPLNVLFAIVSSPLVNANPPCAKERGKTRKTIVQQARGARVFVRYRICSFAVQKGALAARCPQPIRLETR